MFLDIIHAIYIKILYLAQKYALSVFPLIEIQYLPCIAWFCQCSQHEQLIIEQHEHYQKRSLRNRCYIRSNNGILQLSIPLLKGKHQQMPIKQVEISYDSNWQSLHQRTIQSAYGRTPFFEHYWELLQPCWEIQVNTLWEYNMFCIQQLLNCLKLNAQIAFSESYSTSSNDPFDLRDKYGIQEIRRPAQYYSVFESKAPFDLRYSIIDLLFHEGPLATTHLQSFRIE